MVISSYALFREHAKIFLMKFEKLKIYRRLKDSNCFMPCVPKIITAALVLLYLLEKMVAKTGSLWIQASILNGKERA